MKLLIHSPPVLGNGNVVEDMINTVLNMKPKITP